MLFNFPHNFHVPYSYCDSSFFKGTDRCNLNGNVRPEIHLLDELLQMLLNTEIY